MNKPENKQEFSLKLIFIIIITLSIIWSFAFTHFSFQRSGFVNNFGTLFYGITMLILTYGFLPLLILEIVIKWRKKITLFDIVYYSLIILWLVNFLFNRTQDWITD